MVCEIESVCERVKTAAKDFVLKQGSKYNIRIGRANQGKHRIFLPELSRLLRLFIERIIVGIW